MKTTLYCLAIALAFRIALAQSVEIMSDHGKEPADALYPAKQLFISGGMYGRWLTILRFDSTVTRFGFDPVFTYAICKFKPVVKKLPNGYYQITFVSEITEKPPGIP